MQKYFKLIIIIKNKIFKNKKKMTKNKIKWIIN